MSEFIQEYSKTSLMYKDQETEYLRTGDIICLDVSDFKKFVKHKSILTVFEQFEADPCYKQHFWAILNKPCDIFHDPAKARFFKGNLFIAPLLGFKEALKKGILGDFVVFQNLKSPENVFLEVYTKYLLTSARGEAPPKGSNESGKDYGVRIQQMVQPIISKIEKELEGSEGKFKDPQDVITAMKEFLETQESLLASIIEIEKSPSWKNEVSNFEKNRADVEKQNKSIIIKANSEDGLSSICLNQTDSMGIFYYEPHIKISKIEYDLSYIICLQDMLTLKVQPEALSSGALFDLLKSKRILSLDENFSDRLLNIMGNYFSKIGTDDVRHDKVLELYAKVYPDKFYLNKGQYDSYHAKKDL